MVEVDIPERGRHPEIHEDVLSTHHAAMSCHQLLSTRAGGERKAARAGLTRGSCGIGRAPISVRLSAAMPADSSVHAVLLSDIQVMYFAISNQKKIGRGQDFQALVS